jgi:hypothetical protein
VQKALENPYCVSYNYEKGTGEGITLMNEINSKVGDARTKYQDSIKYGALRELTAIKMFIERGFVVSVPSMSARYDFIAEKYPAIIRVQVKNLILKKGNNEGKSSHELWSIRTYSMAYGKRRPYEIEDCDMVVGICLDTGSFAIAPISEIQGKTEFRLSGHRASKGKEYLNTYRAIDDFMMS